MRWSITEPLGRLVRFVTLGVTWLPTSRIPGTSGRARRWGTRGVVQGDQHAFSVVFLGGWCGLVWFRYNVKNVTFGQRMAYDAVAILTHLDPSAFVA